VSRRHLLLLTLGVSAVSFSAVLVRLADAPPLAVAFYRCAMASAVVLPLALLRNGPAFRRLTRRQLGLCVMSGAFLALHFATWIPSVSLTTVAASTVLVTTSPLWVALLGRLIGERMSKRAAGGVLIALVGTVIITGGGLGGSGRDVAGDALAVLGALFAAAYVLAGRSLRQELPLLPYVSVVYVTSAALMAVAMLARGTPFTGYSPKVWLLFALMTAGPQLLGHTVFNLLLGELSATVVAVSIMAEPVGATVLAFAVLGEAPGLATLIGSALVLTGVYVGITAQTRVSLAGAAPVE